MDPKQAHWFVSLAVDKNGVLELCALDFLGSQLFQGELTSSEELEDVLGRLDPKEILLPQSHVESVKVAELFPQLADGGRWAARFTVWPGASAKGNLEDYLLYTQRCSRDGLSAYLPDSRDLSQISGRKQSDFARLPAAVLAQWAIVPELFLLLDGAGSAVGSRQLRNILSTPLRNVDRIRVRQEYLKSFTQSQEFLAHAREVYDIERLLGRFRIGVAAPKELLKLRASLESVDRALDLCPALSDKTTRDFHEQESLAPLADLRGSLEHLRKRLGRALRVEIDFARTQSLWELLNEGFDSELDRLRELHLNAEKWLQDFEARMRNETQISTLKVRYNRVFGYYIEITKTHLARVPPHFERKQTTVNGERFTCQELREKEHEILSAGYKAEARAGELLQALQKEVLQVDTSLRALIAHFAWNDALAGVSSKLRKLSVHGPWSVPEVSEGDFHFTIREARHAIIESVQGSFVPNSIELGLGSKRLLLLTGPNMAGKSTLMRQTGLCLLLAQCGFPVPAAAMSFAPCSGFYSRMGASDRILDGESTFMVEMRETAQLLKEADSNSFVLIDEIGRGTSTEDGLSIARAVLEYLHNEVRALTLFATHYHELSDLIAPLANAFNGSMAIREWKGELVFLRTLKLEPAESSYGIYVARMAGLPKKVLTQAQAFFKSTQLQNSKRGPQLDLFSAQQEPASEIVVEPVESREASVAKPKLEVLGELATLDPETMSPRQAWDFIDRWVSSLKREDL